ncbi:MAG: permease prefix domain 1-containing protein [Limisphaerales bacterium]
MFDLNQAISDWRQQMTAGGVKRSAVMDELEGHLRAEIASLVSNGMSEADAFRSAESRLGDARTVGNEFKKLDKASSKPLETGSLLWTGFSMVLAAGLLTGLLPGKPSFLLMAHTFCLTAGYAAVFLTGGCGIYYVCCRWVGRLPPAGPQTLSAAVLSLSGLSAGLVLIGLLLGVFWSGRNSGSYFAGGAQELGTVFASVWLVAFWAVQRFGNVPRQLRMLLCILGDLVVSLVWFGAGIIAHGHELGDYWLLDAWLGLHLVLFVVGVLPRFEAAET